MIDSDGYRANVGIIVGNRAGEVFWCKRTGQSAWQFPQGGIQARETPRQAVLRELREETGLLPEHVRIVGCTRGWLRYRLPRHLIRRRQQPRCIGQKQRWFLLHFLGDEHCVKLNGSAKPEFDGWCWVDYWRPIQEVIAFKRRVYELALSELAPLRFPERHGAAIKPRSG